MTVQLWILGEQSYHQNIVILCISNSMETVYMYTIFPHLMSHLWGQPNSVTMSFTVREVVSIMSPVALTAYSIAYVCMSFLLNISFPFNCFHPLHQGNKQVLLAVCILA